MASAESIENVRQQAQDKFFQERVQVMSRTFFPDSAIHEDFILMLQKLLKFNSMKQMGVLDMTWKNMCNKTREFFLPEIEVCFEILERATPNELINPMKLFISSKDLENDEFDKFKSDSEILKEYNEVEYPKIKEILKPMREMYNAIDKAISIPMANKINADCKMALKLPIGSAI